jgi:hypothetical protein
MSNIRSKRLTLKESLSWHWMKDVLLLKYEYNSMKMHPCNQFSSRAGSFRSQILEPWPECSAFDGSPAPERREFTSLILPQCLHSPRSLVTRFELASLRQSAFTV